MPYDVIAIGTSAGGIEALKRIMKSLTCIDEVVVIVVQHLTPTGKSYLSKIISDMGAGPAVEIQDKTKFAKGKIFVVPPNYHGVVEKTGWFTLLTTEKVCFARPSIDVTFESVADAFGENVIGVLLTGANHDGGVGLRKIKEAGGYTIVQNPETAEAKEMPTFGIKHADPDEIVDIDDIGNRINYLVRNYGEKI